MIRLTEDDVRADALWAGRHLLASIVRYGADSDGDPRVARRLRRVAAVFEAGIARFDARVEDKEQ